MNRFIPDKKKFITSRECREDVLRNIPLLFYRNTFYSIVAVLEARDSYTAHHSERVAVMASRFCDVLRLPALQREMIEMTAAVHDIGKAGISDATLKKPGRLTDEEWAEIKNHPTIGAEIIKKAGQESIMPEMWMPMSGEGRLDHVAAGVAAHHERWNGSGYPNGLAGNDIPLVSRIIALCDSVDAMLSKRVYRDALSPEVCKDELRKGRGIMYDPSLTDSFLAAWDYIVGSLYSKEGEKLPARFPL